MVGPRTGIHGVVSDGQWQSNGIITLGHGRGMSCPSKLIRCESSILSLGCRPAGGLAIGGSFLFSG
jgi:hypothetical protein